MASEFHGILFLPYIQIIIQSRLDQSMEENQDLKVCQDMHILPFEKVKGMLPTSFRMLMGTGEGMLTWDFSCICITSVIEREICPKYGKKVTSF